MFNEHHIQCIGIVGAGQMGAGIAQTAASAGYQVILCDAKKDWSLQAHQKIKAQLEKLVTKGKLLNDQAQLIVERIKPEHNIKTLSGADFIIEAIVEDVTIKRTLFKELDQIAKPSTILASNTSSISLTQIASATKRPDKIIGMHFMNPVPVMQLVELIRALQTSDQTYEYTQALVKKFNKTAVLSKEAPGFIVNRILMPMINEAIFALDEQLASKEDIDTAMKLGTNQPMGPLTLADFIGLDTVLYILEVMHHELGEDKYRPSPLLRRYVAAGWLGKKTGQGFYNY